MTDSPRESANAVRAFALIDALIAHRRDPLARFYAAFGVRPVAQAFSGNPYLGSWELAPGSAHPAIVHLNVSAHKDDVPAERKRIAVRFHGFAGVTLTDIDGHYGVGIPLAHFSVPTPEAHRAGVPRYLTYSRPWGSVAIGVSDVFDAVCAVVIDDLPTPLTRRDAATSHRR